MCKLVSKYYVYIIKSIDFGKYYTGSTSDYKKRLKYHNMSSNKSTRPYKPYKLVYLEAWSDKGDAIRREMKIKSYKGGGAFKNLISSWDGGVVNRNGL